MKIKCDKAGAGLRNARHIIRTQHVNMTRRQAAYMGQVPSQHCTAMNPFSPPLHWEVFLSAPSFTAEAT